MKYLILILILIACKDPVLPKPLHDPTFDSYVAYLKSTYKQYVGKDYLPKISIKFDDQVEAAQHTLVPNQISIGPKYWDSLNETERKITMLHEFGHQLGREHSNDFKDHRPTSIMFGSGVVSDYYFLENEDFYLKELFSYE